MMILITIAPERNASIILKKNPHLQGLQYAQQISALVAVLIWVIAIHGNIAISCIVRLRIPMILLGMQMID
jgi:hypothetical protein